MATSELQFPASSFVFPDGSASNLGAGIARYKGTQGPPAIFFLVATFDGAGAVEHAYTPVFEIPDNYAADGSLRVVGRVNSTSAANVKMQANVSCVTPGDADTLDEHAFSTAASATIAVNTTEAKRQLTGTITLNMDSAAPGDSCVIHFFRDSADGSDTSTVDFEIEYVKFIYTTT
jgi:hypothetical protein